MTYMYIFILRKNILFYFEEKIMFIRDKNKIEDFERERNLSVLENEKRWVLSISLLKIHIDKLKFELQTAGVILIFIFHILSWGKLIQNFI